MTNTSSPALPITVDGETVQIGEKVVNLYGVLSYLDEGNPDWLVLTTFNLSEDELAAILDFADTQPELAGHIARRQQDEFNQRVLTALHGTYRLSRNEYALISVMPLLGGLFLGLSLTSASTTAAGDHSAGVVVGGLLLVLGILALYTGYKTRYTFDGQTISCGQIFFTKHAWSVPYATIDMLRTECSQHLEYLHITTTFGKAYHVHCIETIKAVIDHLPEPDKYLI